MAAKQFGRGDTTVGKIKSHSGRNSDLGNRLQRPAYKRRALAVAVASALSIGQAWAQDTQKDDDAVTSDGTIEEIVTTGIRQNLQSAQALKRNAETVIESITAEELGSFPDKSVAEALQRVAGITVNRFAASSDTAHFSAEPSGVIVRGLNQVRTEFNGRDTFSANSSRGLSWGDVSPELMSGVDTYKNQMAELIEGGIAGTVNMRTRLPFDQDDNTFAISAAANYGDLSDQWTPEMSGLFSKRWNTANGGEFGVMANAAYSKVETRSEGIQLYRMNRFHDVFGADTEYFIPAIISARDNLYNRERKGFSMALQWASADDRLEFTTQYNRSEYNNAWEEYLVQTSPADLSYAQSVFFEIQGQDVNSTNQDSTIPIPAPGTDPFTFDDRGLFQTGVITTGSGWWGTTDVNDPTYNTFAHNDSGQPMVNACYDWAGCSPTQRGIDTATTTRSNNNTNMTQDLSFNFKWAPTDKIRGNFDVQYIDSTVQNYDIEVGFNTYATAMIDMTGKRPTFALMDPVNVNQSPGGFTNPDNYYIHHIMDHLEDSDGNELAFRADFEFDVDSDWMRSIKVGTRYADRDQNVNWSGYNWQNVANNWTGNQAGYYNLDLHGPDTQYGSGFTGYPEGYYVNRSFDKNFYGGGIITPNEYVFANMNMLQHRKQWADAMSAPALGLGGGVGWDPICSNTGDRAAEIPGSCYTPAEVVDVSEETLAFYAQLNYGNGDTRLFGVPVSGNVGVRYVETSNISGGGISYPQISQQNLVCESTASTDPNIPSPPVPFTVGCYLNPADIAFQNGASNTNSVSANHQHWLPSFNMKLELTDEWLLRFAASRAISRPDMGNLKNYLGVGATLPSVDDANDPLWIKNGSGQIVGANVKYTGGAQNPFLAPVVATQYDISLEYYFADVGSLTMAMFEKSFDDYIQFGKYNREVSNNGVNRVVEVSGPLNGSGAKINGYEIAFQRFFDFLPSPLDGLGVQANFTHINNKGITNLNVTDVSAGPNGESTTITGQAPDMVQVDKLEGLSDNSYTVIGMYEKGRVSGRLAYSWRSKYLVTAIDCCVAYPIWDEDYGQLDGSLRWSITDRLELALQVSNITNSETVLRQQVSNADDGGQVLPNAWFQNDRRYTLSFRYRNK
jgi:iron complex outermembrane recepter protein